MDSAKRRLNIAVIGMGGFAREHHEVVRTLEGQGECRLVAACDPRLHMFRPEMKQWKFRSREVQVFSDYISMLNAWRDKCDVVTVPTPIPLHAEMHGACVDRGLACYLEKPPTLDHNELELMLLNERRAQQKSQVAFNFIVESDRQALKRRLLDGEFGRLRRVTFLGLWPRPASYFTRANWAGRLALNGQLVLDSCVGNAMAHYVHNLLFWCGEDGVLSWQDVAYAQAELYRAHAIESMDTVFAAGVCRNGVEVRIGATHACAGSHHSEEKIECDKAVLNYRPGEEYRIDWKNGNSERIQVARGSLLVENFLTYFSYLRGQYGRPLTRLIDCRPFVRFYNLLFVAARKITTVRDEQIERTKPETGVDQFIEIKGVAEACKNFCSTGHFPGQQGTAWAQRGGQASADDVRLLTSVIGQMKG